VDLPDMEEDDELLQQSMEIIRQTRRASTSGRIMQRRSLRIGDPIPREVPPASWMEPCWSRN
jgi:hypothetical protein